MKSEQSLVLHQKGYFPFEVKLNFLKIKQEIKIHKWIDWFEYTCLASILTIKHQL